MTGKEHYREAESILTFLHSQTERIPSDHVLAYLAEAQVHASLALAYTQDDAMSFRRAIAGI